MRNGRRTISVLLVAAMTAGLAACGTTEAAENVTESETPENTDYNFTVSYDGIQTGDVSSGVAVHDPSIYEENGTYYIFGSHMSAAKSDDLLHWESIADGYNKTNPVYGQISGQLQLFSRYDVDQFVQKLRTSNAPALCTLTGGVHLHNIQYQHQEDIQRVVEQLCEQGLLFCEENEGV